MAEKRRVGRPRRIDKRYAPEERLHLIRRLRSEGATLEAIALQVGLTPAAVRYHLIFGLQVQSRRREKKATRRARMLYTSASEVEHAQEGDIYVSGQGDL